MKKSLLLIGLLLIMTAATLGCGGDIPGISSSPEEIVNNAIKKSNEVNSRHIDYDLNVLMSGDLSSLDPSLAELEDIDLTFRGVMDMEDVNSDSPALRGDINIEGLSDVFDQIGGGDPEMQMQFNLVNSMFSELEFVLVDDVAYIKLAGTWYELGDMAEASDIANLDLENADETSECFRNAMTDPEKFGAGTLFTNLQQPGDEQIDGTDTHHITADVDMDKVMTAVADIARSCDETETAGGIEGGKGEIVDVFESFTIEMWIDHDDNFRQIKVKIEIDPEAVSSAAEDLDSGSGSSGSPDLESLVLTINLKFSQLNESFDISKPEGNILQIEDLMGSFGGGFGGSDFDDLEGLEDLEDIDDLGIPGTTTGTGTSTSSFSR